MSSRDLTFGILLITIVRFSTTSVIPSRGLFVVRLSPVQVRSLEDVPDRWRTVHPDFKKPQIEIQMMKDHVLPNWMIVRSYKYSSKNYDGASKMTSTADEKKIPRIENIDTQEWEKEKENGDQDNIVMPDGDTPQIGFRNIIGVPEWTYCPKGQKEDSTGRCRTVIM